MHALPRPAGVGVLDGGPLQHRPDGRTDGVMHHSVSEGSGRDLALLGVMDDKPSRGAGSPDAFRQLRLQSDDLGLKVPEKARHLGSPLLSAGSTTGGGQERREGAHRAKETAGSTHAAAGSAGSCRRGRGAAACSRLHEHALLEPQNPVPVDSQASVKA